MSVNVTATGITHFVAFTFGININQTQIDTVVQNMLALKEKCLNADGEPYMLSLSGGTNNNPDNRNEAITHGFVGGFASSADRDYYLHEDPVHLSFEASIVDLVSRAFAFDYTSEVFQPVSEL
ncbi:stress responsive A/B Barrel domain-containing protein [Seiridium cupressi]|uniref:Stress-response A/B barrel domain-containing protein n=1 Tax=Seiridium unicorne TaxID=138068 RepID=A0ABR2V4G8_9PEZI